jgi:methionyl-tRNA formyltransferase
METNLGVLVYSLGFKGFSVVKAIKERLPSVTISCIIGKDSGVSDDWSESLVSFCEKNGVNYTHRLTDNTRSRAVDVSLAVGWRWIIKDVPQNKLIVFHDSLLPKYRGFAPLVSALINREHRTGVTALYGTDEYDRGNILLQREIEIFYPTCIEAEIQRMSAVYADLAVELLSRLMGGAISDIGIPQDDRDATYSLWRDEDDYRIDWSSDASDIEHFVACVGSPYKGASALLEGEKIHLLKVRAKADVRIENRSPGKVIFVEENLPVVVCGSGLLMLLDVRNAEGDSVLPLKRFRSRFC